MKIVRIIARLNVGGPSRHVVWLTSALNNGEFSSVLVAGTVPEGEESMEYFADANGVTPIYLRSMSRELSLRDFSALWGMLKILWRERPDVIHTHTAKAGTIGRMAGFIYRILSRRKVKLIHTYHGHVFHSYYGRVLTKFFLLIERLLASFTTDRIIVISEQQRDEILKKFSVGSESQYSVVRLGLDLSAFRDDPKDRERFRREIGLTEGDFTIGFVGRLTSIKNIPLLLESFGVAVRSMEPHASRLKLVLVGDGGLRRELEREVVRRGLEDLVHFAGNRDDPGSFYAGLDAVALSSLNEGTPLSLIEAMAANRPFISTAVGGVIDLAGDVVRDIGGVCFRQRGITVNSGDASAMAAGLLQIAKGSEEIDSMRIRGNEFVRAEYEKARLIKDLANLYRDCAAPSS